MVIDLKHFPQPGETASILLEFKHTGTMKIEVPVLKKAIKEHSDAPAVFKKTEEIIGL